MGIQRRERIPITGVDKKLAESGTEGLVRFGHGKNGTSGGGKPRSFCVVG